MRHPRQCTQPSPLACLGCHNGFLIAKEGSSSHPFNISKVQFSVGRSGLQFSLRNNHALYPSIAAKKERCPCGKVLLLTISPGTRVFF